MSENWPRRRKGRRLTGLSLIVTCAVLAGSSAEALNFVVDSTGDQPDASVGVGGCATALATCTLRAAIQESNFAGVGNTITFNLGAGPYSIAVGAAGLPAITRAVTIDGYSQAGSSANTLPVGSNAVLLIELNGAATGTGVSGLTVNVAGVTIQGLVINRFAAYGIVANAAGATIRGNFVGTNAAGTAALGNSRVDAVAGIGVFGGGATLGGTAPADRNLVSGHNANGARGIQFWNSSGNTIQGNYVGTNAAGTAPLPNIGAGLALDGTGSGSDNNLVGGTVAGAGNLFARGGFEGVAAYTGSTGNAILGNSISLNTGLGIDLGGNGVTGNDPLDGDGGPNNQLNFPVINSVFVVGTSLAVGFSLDVPAGSYRVEFFRNPSGVDVPNGEGEVFAGFQNVNHGGAGSQSFSTTITGAAGDRITATTTLCTDGGVCAAFSDTSEFSANLIATPINYRSIGSAPDSSTGSVSTTNNSQTVAGVGTSWLAINRGRGDVISICDQAFPTCTTSTNYTVLSVGSDSQLTLTTPYTGTTGSHGYTIRRQFATLTAWEGCIDGQGGSPPPAAPCFWFPAPSASLVADNRSEVGIAYNDTIGADFVGPLVIDNSVTDATHTITLTADGNNRHYGIPGQGVLINSGGGVPAVQVFDDFVTVEWMEIAGGGGSDGLRVNLLTAGTGSLVTLRSNLIHNVAGDGIALYDDDGRVDVYNNISYGNVSGLWINPGALLATSRIQILNNTFYGNQGGVSKAAGISAARVLLRNNISVFNNPAADYSCDPGDSVTANSSNNLDEDGSGGAAHSPAGGNITSTVAGVAFVNAGAGNLHIQPASSARDVGGNLGSVFTTDIDAALRQTPWDIGADEVAAVGLFRSVGITATALASGAGNALTISGSTATFATGLPGRIGVGDVIQFDSDNNGSIDALAFIHGRTNSQTFTVKDRNGAAPTATATPDSDWSIFRAYTSLFDWEAQNENANISNAPVPLRNFDTSTNLVIANTTMNVACYGDGADTTAVTVAGWTTGISSYIRIYTPYAPSEVGTSQRHAGTWNATTAYRLQVAAPANGHVLRIEANYVRVDGLQLWLLNDAFYAAGVFLTGAAGVASYDISNNIVRGNGGSPSQPGRIGINTYVTGAVGSVARIWNNLIYDFIGIQIDVAGILLDDPDVTAYVYNNTIVDGSQGIAQYQGPVVAKNNIAYNNLDNWNGTFSAASTHNLSGPGADPQIPATSARNGVPVTFVNTGLDDFHLLGSDVGALNQGTNLSADPNLAIFYDLDGQVRQAPWDMGADDVSGTTAVELLSFEARALDSAVSLSWETASELDNLGFHLYRSESPSGPYARVTSSLIPGLGSSPTGRSYAYRDGGLVNGRTYFYELEDIETTGQTKRHGPVSAAPAVGADDEGGSGDAGGSDDSGDPGESGGDGAGGRTYGEAGLPSLRVLERGESYALIELRTPGFVAVSEPDGSVRLEVAGFELPQSPGSPAVPVKRALVEALAGRGARITSVQTEDLIRFSGLQVAPEGSPEVVVTKEGMVRPGLARRKAAAGSARRGYYPRTDARLLGTIFQGETKKARLELSPLRYDANGGRVVLAQRLLVRVEFTGIDAREKPLGGARGRRPPAGEVRSKGRLAQLVTRQAGLYKVGFESVFGRGRGIPVANLRLSRRGEVVPFHVEPRPTVFGPGSFLYFVGGGDLNASGDMVYELEQGLRGTTMTRVPATPSGSEVSTYEATRTFEENKYYQAALLDAPDLWLWELMVSPVSKSQVFPLSDVDTGSTGHLRVWLQGASDFEAAPDHHVRVLVNGAFVAETSWDGKREQVIESALAPGILQEGANTLTVENVGDTPAAYSMVFLNRFEVRQPRRTIAEGGRLDGLFTQSGSAAVSGLPPGSLVLDTTGSPTWLTGGTAGAGIFRFRAEAGRRYLVVDPAATLLPEVRLVPSGLRRTTQRADWLLLAPREFLPAAQPLVDLRREQGLVARTVALEDVYAEFGFGEAGPEAIRAFLAYAYQNWKRPSPRYVVLLGDSTYDPKDYLGTHVADRLPFYPIRTSFLWTASDPAYASVNGDDLVPDLAIGRLPARSLAEAETLVGKLVAFERAGMNLDGRAVLVADNADVAGNFEADAHDLSTTVLQGREVEEIYLRDLGAGTRAAIRGAFDSGSSLLSYIGHGGTAVWASENVFNNQDVSALAAQSRQPLVLTLNCLNGFFHFPPLDSLAEALVKAEGKGAIAAFSPSGLSLNEAAHLYHRAVLAEITQGNHPRIGDALLAAQSAYADSGSFPELLSIYHLFGDPALRLR